MLATLDIITLVLVTGGAFPSLVARTLAVVAFAVRLALDRVARVACAWRDIALVARVVVLARALAHVRLRVGLAAAAVPHRVALHGAAALVSLVQSVPRPPGAKAVVALAVVIGPPRYAPTLRAAVRLALAVNPGEAKREHSAAHHLLFSCYILRAAPASTDVGDYTSLSIPPVPVRRCYGTYCFSGSCTKFTYSCSARQF